MVGLPAAWHLGDISHSHRGHVLKNSGVNSAFWPRRKAIGLTLFPYLLLFHAVPATPSAPSLLVASAADPNKVCEAQYQQCLKKIQSGYTRNKILCERDLGSANAKNRLHCESRSVVNDKTQCEA